VLIHALIVVAAVRATQSATHPVRLAAPVIHWQVTMPATHATAGTGHGAGVSTAPPLPAPLTVGLAIGPLPEPLAVPAISPGRPGIPGAFRPDTVAGSRLLHLTGGEDVTDAPELLTILAPRYPTDAPARAHAVSDSVVVEYVITAAGMVDWDHITVVAMTDASFERAVRDALAGAHFRPAHRGGVAAPALVRQAFRFVRK
jgi:TonB family protein